MIVLLSIWSSISMDYGSIFWVALTFIETSNSTGCELKPPAWSHIVHTRNDCFCCHLPWGINHCDEVEQLDSTFIQRKKMLCAPQEPGIASNPSPDLHCAFACYLWKELTTALCLTGSLGENPAPDPRNRIFVANSSYLRALVGPLHLPISQIALRSVLNCFRLLILHAYLH